MNGAERFGPSNVRTFARDAVRYGLASVVALACDYAALLGLTAAGLHYLLASIVSFSLGMVVAYTISIRFVFAGRRATSRMREAAGFVAVGLAGLVLTQLLLAILVSGCGLAVGLAKIPTTLCVFAFNFLARRSLVFAKPDLARAALGQG